MPFVLNMISTKNHTIKCVCLDLRWGVISFFAEFTNTKPKRRHLPVVSNLELAFTDQDYALKP